MISHAKDEDSVGFNQDPSLRVIESMSDARNDALSCCMDEAKGINGRFNILANEWARRYVWVTRRDCWTEEVVWVELLVRGR